VAELSRLSRDEQLAFYAGRARLNYSQGRYEAALADSEKAITLDYSAEMSLLGIESLHLAGRHREARSTGSALLSTFREDVDDAKLKAEFFKTMARVHVALGEDRKVAAYCDESLGVNPGQPDVLYLRAVAAMRLKDYETAEANFLMTIEQSDVVPPALWSDLGRLYGSMRKYEEGTRALQKSLETYPYDAGTKRALRDQYVKSKRKKRGK